MAIVSVGVSIIKTLVNLSIRALMLEEACALAHAVINKTTVVQVCQWQRLTRDYPEPDLSAESTPTDGWCQMKQASIFTEILPKVYKIFTNFLSFPQISNIFDEFYDNS